jgi:hypothetical protein
MGKRVKDAGSVACFARERPRTQDRAGRNGDAGRTGDASVSECLPASVRRVSPGFGQRPSRANFANRSANLAGTSARTLTPSGVSWRAISPATSCSSARLPPFA